MKKHKWGLLYSLVLVLFTAYVLLDTFVITRVQTAIVPTTQPAVTQPPAVTSADYYQDENITITLTTIREYDTTIYVADVQLKDASLLKTALASNSFGRNVTEKTSTMAERAGAILAINGDYYGAQERGYVIRNGKLLRSSMDRNQEDLVIYPDGSFEIINESRTSAEELLEKGAVQVLSFGPSLVVDGEITVTERDEVGRAKESNPRTAIALIEPLHYLFVVADGRTNDSEGLSLLQLATVLVDLGATTAYNLDGGGSSTMIFQGELINKPTSNGRSFNEREISDIVYIGY